MIVASNTANMLKNLITSTRKKNSQEIMNMLNSGLFSCVGVQNNSCVGVVLQIIIEKIKSPSVIDLFDMLNQLGASTSKLRSG